MKSTNILENKRKSRKFHSVPGKRVSLNSTILTELQLSTENSTNFTEIFPLISWTYTLAGPFFTELKKANKNTTNKEVFRKTASAKLRRQKGQSMSNGGQIL